MLELEAEKVVERNILAPVERKSRKDGGGEEDEFKVVGEAFEDGLKGNEVEV